MEKLTTSFDLEKSDLKALAKLIGRQPPCKTCIVQASCYESYFDFRDNLIIDLKHPCENAIDWFERAEIINHEIKEFMLKRDGSLLSSEDIIEIIKAWDDPDEFLEEKIGISFAKIVRIGSYIEKLKNGFCWTERIDDYEIIILKDRIEKALKYFKNNRKYGFWESDLNTP